MDKNQLKTTWRVRIIVGIIAFLMLFSTFAVYTLIIVSSENKKNASNVASEELAKVEKELDAKREEAEALTDILSEKYFSTFKKYRSNVKSYNAQAVNNAGLKTKDIVVGKGKEITADTEYFAYYIGWCADESVFDSSFDTYSNPSALVAPIQYTPNESSFVAGWEEGILGMKIGGVREIDIPGELAYGDTREICGGTNSPLKFIIYPVEVNEEYKKTIEEFDILYKQYSVLYYSQNQGN